MSEPDAIPVDDPRLLGLRRIVWVMDRLRGEGGCPWDRVQTPASLRGYLLEEAYELLEALDGGDRDDVREELGDLLFQIVFHARIAEEDEDGYHLGDVAAGIADKLLRRHPHVFQPDQALDDPNQVLVAWQEHKRREGRTSVLQGVPARLPALLRAQRIQEKASFVGFDWPDERGPLDKLSEELGELKAEVEGGGAKARLQHELGDVLFSIVNLARHLELNAEDALREASGRFERRFQHVEQAAGPQLRDLGLPALDALWEQAKQLEEPPAD